MHATTVTDDIYIYTVYKFLLVECALTEQSLKQPRFENANDALDGRSQLLVLG